MKIDLELDLRGMHCPLPLLKTKQGLMKLNSNQVLKVLATDPSSQRDFISFTRISGHTLLSYYCEKGSFVYLIRCK